jgi:hypothetical protein
VFNIFAKQKRQIIRKTTINNLIEFDKLKKINTELEPVAKANTFKI